MGRLSTRTFVKCDEALAEFACATVLKEEEEAANLGTRTDERSSRLKRGKTAAPLAAMPVEETK